MRPRRASLWHHHLPVLAVVGKLGLLFAGLMAVPLGFALVQHDGAAPAFGTAMAVTALIGLALWQLGRRVRRELQPRDGFLPVVLACLNSIGPGLGSVGPAGNFQGLSDFQTWICSAAMMLGRLELLSVLVLFTPQFWRR